jgi:hypothetical protein
MRNPSESQVIGDDLIEKMAERLGIKIEREEKKDRIKIASSEIGASVQTLGGGMCKFSHRIWQLKKEGEQYFLERAEGEKE